MVIASSVFLVIFSTSSMPAKLHVLIGQMPDTSKLEIAQVIVENDEKLKPYVALCKTSPEAIVRILRVEEPNLPEGFLDSEPNFSLALSAVGELVSSLRLNSRKPNTDEMKIWKGLVNADVLDAVTELVADPALLPEVEIEIPGLDEITPEIEAKMRHEARLSFSHCAKTAN